jgi:hypothetical protein
MHRSCLAQGAPVECTGSQKATRTDYKEKFDNIQKLLFGKSNQFVYFYFSSIRKHMLIETLLLEKEEEPSMDISGSKIYLENSSFTNGDILTNLPSDYDQSESPTLIDVYINPKANFHANNSKKRKLAG